MNAVITYKPTNTGLGGKIESIYCDDWQMSNEHDIVFFYKMVEDPKIQPSPHKKTIKIINFKTVESISIS